MFWRFGFASTSTLDTLLDKQGVTVEELLDEDDLLQECKAQNAKLVDFLKQPRVIKRLFEHVVGSAEVSGPGGREWEEKVRFKYPYVASEVLSSETLAIVEAALAQSEELLDPFWNAILHSKPGHVQAPLPHHSHPLLAGSPSASPQPPPSMALPTVLGGGSTAGNEDEKKAEGTSSSSVPTLGQSMPSASTSSLHSSSEGPHVVRASDNGPGKSVLAGYWAKVNGVFLDKKPREMLAYIHALPRIVERFVAHLETPAVVDLLYRIISCEQSLPNAGVIEWLSEQGLVPQIVDLLSPSHSVDLHNTVSELIKAIIALSAPSPAGMVGQDGFGYGAGGSSFGQPEQPIGVVNKLVRELASEAIVRKLVSFMLDSTHPSNLQRRLSQVASGEGGQGSDDEGDDGDEGGLSLSFSKGKRSDRLLGLSTNQETAVDDDEDDLPLNPSLTPAFESSKSPMHRDSTVTVRPTDFFPPVKAPMCPVSPETCSSSLIIGIGILIELIRKNNSDYFEQHLFHALRSHLLQRQQEISAGKAQARSEGTLTEEPKDEEDEEMEGMEEAMAEITGKLGIVHLGPMLSVLCERLSDFQALIERTPAEQQDLTTTLGKVRPLTFERYRITELYAELLHCSNMALLNRAQGEGPQYSVDGILQGGIQGLQVLARTLQGSDADDSTAGDSADPVATAAAAGQTSSTSSSPPKSPSSGKHTRQASTIGGDESTNTESDPFADDGGEASASATSPTSPSRTPEEEEEEAKSIRSALSSMSLADLTSPAPSEPPSPSLQDGNKKALVVGDLLKQRFLDVGIIPSVLGLFFNYPWNNFLHNVVYDILQQCFNGRMDSGLNRSLTLAVFSQGSLPSKILDGHRRNDESMAGPRKIRLGFMGHMNLIAEETCKLLERYPKDVAENVEVPQPEWDDFVRDVLKENREREAAPLAGGRPMAMSQFGNSFGDGTSGQTGDNDAFASYLSSQMNSGGNASDDDDDDDSDDDAAHHSWVSGQHHAGGGSGAGFEDVFEPGSAERVRSSTGDDEEWGSGSGGGGDGFGDFQSSANQPLTSADWAANAFDESGQGEGTTPPESPTSSTEDDTPFVDLADSSTYRSAVQHRRSSSSEAGSGLAQFRQQMSGEVAATSLVARRRSSSASSGSASGSTDPTAAHAADADEPLGPGVASDAEVKGGMVQRTLEDGTVVSVPLDDVAVAASSAEANEEKREGAEEGKEGEKVEESAKTE